MHLVFPATLLPDVQSDPMSLLLGADHVHVVGDEELASAGYRGTPWRYEHGGTEVRGPIIMLQLQEKKKINTKIFIIYLFPFILKGNLIHFNLFTLWRSTLISWRQFFGFTPHAFYSSYWFPTFPTMPCDNAPYPCAFRSTICSHFFSGGWAKFSRGRKNRRYCIIINKLV